MGLQRRQRRAARAVLVKPPAVAKKSAAKPRLRKDPPEKRAPIGGTCGCPIHHDRCNLYRWPKRFTTSTVTASAGPMPVPKRGWTPSPSVAPSEDLSEWARAQVSQVFCEVKAIPRPLWKRFLQQKLLRFHPDKKASRDRWLASRPDAEVTEVFMDIKKLYDCISVTKR